MVEPKTATLIRKKTLRIETKYGAVWVCSDPGHHGNPFSKKGCGYYNGEWTVRVDGGRGKDQWKTTCKKCGKKASLTRAKVIHMELTRPDLIHAVELLNQGDLGVLA